MKKILIVEDDAVTAHAYRRCLERAGYEVHVAVDGQAGLDHIQGSAPDGVLLDLMMPKMNGIELLKSIRACHHLARIPVMVSTTANCGRNGAVKNSLSPRFSPPGAIGQSA